MPFKKRTRAGDVIKIADADGVDCLSVTLFSSQIYKDVILLGILKPNHQSDVILPNSFQSLIYTSSAPLKNLRWKIVDQVASIDNVKYYSLRTIAGFVWCEDSRGRIATEGDRVFLPEMDCAGMTLAESYIAYLRTGSNVAKYFVRTQKKFERLLSNFDKLRELWPFGF